MPDQVDPMVFSFDDARRAVADGASIEDVSRRFVTGMTPTERLWCLDGDTPTWAGLAFLNTDGYHRSTFQAGQIDRLGFPGIRFSDGPRGAVVGNATCFPVSMARGATWDPELEERVGHAIGQELRAIGANFTGAVCVNILRHPAWGRAQETYGEDPFHVGEMGAAFTRGLQNHVLACVKHFACNSMENARFSVDIQIDEVGLHEVYLPHFRRVIDAGVASVMSAYNSVNGEWCGQNHELLAAILRDEWGFTGFVISDFILGLRDAGPSLTAGLDIEMPFRMMRAQHLGNALDNHEASWALVDTAVERIVSTLLRFDAVLSTPPLPEVLGSPAHRQLAREVAARSVVLLRNEPVDDVATLPLTGTESVGVFGRLAATINVGDGGSSDVWDLDCKTILDGLNDSALKVTYDDGTDLLQAAEVAHNVDVAIVVVGYTYLDEGEFIGQTDRSLMQLFPPADEPDNAHRYAQEIALLPPTVKPDRLGERAKGFSIGGDRSSLRLLGNDVALINAVAATNRRTVVVIQAGSAVVVNEWIGSVPAVLQAWYGGSQAGPGLVDVLLGVVNPSARVPFTVPVDETDLPAFDRDASTFTYDRWHGWWHLKRHGTIAQFPFGFGLSYTDFEIADANVAVRGHEIVVAGTIRNIGQRDGSDVVQVYAELPSTDTPARLVGFQRVEVARGMTSAFEIVVRQDQLASRNPVSHRWDPAVGVVQLSVGRFAGSPKAITHAIELGGFAGGGEAPGVLLAEWQTEAGPVTEDSITETTKRFGL